MDKLGDTKQFSKIQNIVLKGFDPISSGGFTQIPNVVLKHPKLSGNAKLCYAMLLHYAWQKNYCFPGQGTLADDMGATRPTVIKGLKELQKYGLLETKRQGLGKPNIYTLHCTVASN